MSSPTRFFSPSSATAAPQQLKELLPESVSNVAEQLVENSLKSKRASPGSVYTGHTGLVVALIKAARVFPEKSRDFLCYAHRLLTPICKLRREATFLEGMAGTYAVTSVLYQYLGKEQEAENNYRQLLQIGAAVAGMKESECELLYGRAGWLHAIHYVNQYREGVLMDDDAAELVRNVIKQIVLEGMKNHLAHLSSTPPLMWEWHGKQYLGMAHGIAGILYLLLLFVDQLPQTEKELGLEEGALFLKMMETLQFIMDNCRFSSGNVFSSAGKSEADDKLVHWCHGAPGFVSLVSLLLRVPLPKKYERPPQVLLLSWLESLSAVLKERGLLKKGMGLCHGISGNGVSLLEAYAATADSQYLDEAWKFAHFALTHYHELFDAPDRPYSLFEGAGGLLWLLTSLKNPFEAGYPGLELSSSRLTKH